VLQSLSVERHKVQKQLDAGTSRLSAAKAELDTLNKLHASLAQSKADWAARVAAASADLAAAEEAHRREVPPLEKRVHDLMRRLEEANAPEGASSSSGLSAAEGGGTGAGGED